MGEMEGELEEMREHMKERRGEAFFVGPVGGKGVEVLVRYRQEVARRAGFNTGTDGSSTAIVWHLRACCAETAWLFFPWRSRWPPMIVSKRPPHGRARPRLCEVLRRGNSLRRRGTQPAASGAAAQGCHPAASRHAATSPRAASSPGDHGTEHVGEARIRVDHPRVAA